jgi:hypothetical protein
MTKAEGVVPGVEEQQRLLCVKPAEAEVAFQPRGWPRMMASTVVSEEAFSGWRVDSGLLARSLPILEEEV